MVAQGAVLSLLFCKVFTNDPLKEITSSILQYGGGRVLVPRHMNYYNAVNLLKRNTIPVILWPNSNLMNVSAGKTHKLLEEFFRIRRFHVPVSSLSSFSLIWMDAWIVVNLYGDISFGVSWNVLTWNVQTAHKAKALWSVHLESHNRKHLSRFSFHISHSLWFLIRIFVRLSNKLAYRQSVPQ